MGNIEDELVRHYGQASLEQRILDGIAALGRTPETLRPEDLAPLDEFHMGGHAATEALARQMGLAPGMELLDIGSGLGGPARYFARQHGCRVVGVDLVPDFVSAAAMLTRMVGPEGVRFEVGRAGELPFESERFDAATLIHVGMNLPDKPALFGEVARLLKPRGAFGVYDVMQVGEGDLVFPVAWADTPATSFLASPAAYRRDLEAAGFSVLGEESLADTALATFTRMRARIAESGPPPLGLHILMGVTARDKLGNMMANLEAGRIAPVAMVCRKA
jgi:ubiquinone/menaquinone biosynthesis C-methylase UbiE